MKYFDSKCKYHTKIFYKQYYLPEEETIEIRSIWMYFEDMYDEKVGKTFIPLYISNLDVGYGLRHR